MKKSDLYTYCVKEEEKNKSVLLESEELENWKQMYREGIAKNDYSSYFDPDASYRKNCDHQFFDRLVKFLNIMESKLKYELKGNFKYNFVEDEGIEVCGTKNGKDINFYLRSDQFGFSSLSTEKSHPYDLYITKSENSENKDKAINQVIEWIASSRTIGGSFLWPTPFYSAYNPSRGGKITSSKRYYIQDRVDLTLWEIKYYYEKTNKNTIMNRCNKENSNLDIWLEHFKNFETYVKFFHFKPFVIQIDKKMSPTDILTGGINEPQWGDNGENPKIEISNDLDADTVEKMLTCVNNCIIERSKTITDLLNE